MSNFGICMLCSPSIFTPFKCRFSFIASGLDMDDPVISLVALQTFVGSWILSDELCQIIGKNKAEVINSAPFQVKLVYIDQCFFLLCPQIEWLGVYCFCPVCLFVCLFLSVCLSVVIFNIPYNFWTVSDRGFIFGMHTQLMMPFKMTPRSMTLWP